MSTTAGATPATVGSRSAQIVPLLVSIVVSMPFLALASWGDASEGNPLRRFFVTLAVAAACALVVFLWAVPRAERSSRVAPALAALAILSLPAFWLGTTAVLAVGAIWAARRSPGSQAAKAATVGASAAALVALAVLAVIA